MGFGLWYIVHIKFDTCEAVRLTDSGGTLENLIYECRRCKAKAESLRPKDRAERGARCLLLFTRSC